MRKLLLISFLLPIFMAAEASQSPNPPSATSQSNGTRTIHIIRQNQSGKAKLTPGKPIEGSVFLANGTITFSFPLEGDYFEVTVEPVSGSEGYTYGVFDNAYDMELPFDGESGEFKLTIENSSTYSGYFTLD